MESQAQQHLVCLTFFFPLPPPSVRQFDECLREGYDLLRRLLAGRCVRGVSPAAAPRGAVSGPRRGTRVGAAAALRGPPRRKRCWGGRGSAASRRGLSGESRL